MCRGTGVPQENGAAVSTVEIALSRMKADKINRTAGKEGDGMRQPSGWL